MVPSFSTDILPSRYAIIEGKKYLWFSGTDYLGMAYHPVFLSLLSENFERLGSHFGGSRNNTLQLQVFREAEIALSGFTGSEDALLVSSGMLAGFLLRSQLRIILEKHYPQLPFHEIEAPMLHPALSRTPQAYSDWNKWARSSADEITKTATDHRYILYCDAIGSPQTAFFDYSLLSGLPTTWVVADDSHGLGVLGNSGSGSYQLLKNQGVENVMIVASLNKAMGVPGGVLLGKRAILDEIRKSGYYAGGSPMPPVYARALTEMLGQGEYRRTHENLLKNNRYFFERLGVKSLFSHIQGYPVYTTTDSGLFGFLLERGILTSSFSYPTPNDPPLTRLVITAAHTTDDLDTLAAACNDYYA